jgi:nitrite reductase (cytochrome c-552)
MIQTLFKGYGFARSYGSARGHTYVVEDVTSTGRPHKMANCFTCKTPMLSHAVNEQGVEIYSMPFEDFQNDILAQTNEVLSCYNCHANTPGEITVTHTYLANALGEDFSRVDAENLACGQCHVDYYFDPDSKAVTLPYTNLSSMSPDAMLDYYNNLIVDGQVFADYVQEDSGVRQIMINHPELETYLGEGSVHKGMFTCADCHMGTVVTNKGEVYPSHFLQSPLSNAELLKNTCSQCHSDLAAEVAAIQKEAEDRTYEIGYKLEALINRVTEAANSGAYTEEELDAIRMAFRNAQFYWNFVFVENSEGAHNSKLTRDCLDKSETLIAECEALFK